MRWLLLIVVSLLVLFQYRLLLGEGSLSQKAELERRVEQQQIENQKLEARNQKLTASVAGLKDGLEGIEERARNDLGMIRDGETFYMVVDEDKQP